MQRIKVETVMIESAIKKGGDIYQRRMFYYVIGSLNEH